MKIALKLNESNIVVGYVHLATENYTSILQDNDNFIEAIVESFDDIIIFKTKYENGQLIELDDYCEKYYENQRKEEQRFLIQSQLTELNKWFDAYDMQVKQYERNTRLGIESTYHIGDEEFTIEELDDRAIDKANEIKEIRKQIEELNNPIIEDSNEE